MISTTAQKIRTEGMVAHAVFPASGGQIQEDQEFMVALGYEAMHTWRF